MKYIYTYKVLFFTLLIFYILHLFQKDFSSPYEKPIVGDAKAYYAYLPAIFIYQDLSFGFVEENEKKYYSENSFKDFLTETENGKKVNKTFPGVAFLYLPFFLIAHFLTLIWGLDADGYSLIYQYLFDFGHWFYLALGLLFFAKVMEKLSFDKLETEIVAIFLFLGTNIFFYSFVDQSVTHIMNFFMINAFIYYLIRFKSSKTTKSIIFSVVLLCLIVITRPTNILVLAMVPIFISDKSFYKNYVRAFFKLKNFIPILIISFSILSIPFILWKIQTDNWIVYSYGEEGFDFLNPEIYNFLFSYTKGWFLYTPLVFITLIVGLYFLWKESPFKSIYILLFLALCTYIFSSWWCWYYGAGMGQRVMIDFYIIIGYLLLVIYKQNNGTINVFFAILSLFFIYVNIIQTNQIKNGIYPMGSPTKKMYWNHFLNTEKVAKVYLNNNQSINFKQDISFHSTTENIKKGKTYQWKNEDIILTSAEEPFSAVFAFSIPKENKNSQIILSFDAIAFQKSKESRLVITVEETNKMYVIYLSEFLQKTKWVKLEFLFQPTENETHFSAYFWNGDSQEKVYYKDFTLVFLKEN